MQTTNTVRGYSEFFASGFRAVTNRRARRTSTSIPSSSSAAAAAQRSVALDFGHGLVGSANVNTIGFGIGYAPSSSASASKGRSNSKGTSTSTSASSAAGAGARRTLADITQRRRPRPTSMNLIVQDTIPRAPTSPTSGTAATHRAREKTHRRRSSFVSFSSRLFDRLASPFDENASMFSRSSNGSSSRRHTNDHASVEEAQAPEVWITAGGPYTPSAPNGSPLPLFQHHHSIDPFAPSTSASGSPSTKSLFIDLSSSSSSSARLSPPANKRESFLSLTSTNSNRSSLILPSSNFIPSSTFIPLTRKRERPTSIQTMPLPSRSRASSFSFPYSVPSVLSPRNVTVHDKDTTLTQRDRDTKSDFFLILEEEDSSAVSATYPSGCAFGFGDDAKGKGRLFASDEEEEEEDESDEEENSAWDAPASIDWRQFHIDLLTSEDGHN